MIDNNYDGKVFNMTLIDITTQNTDLVLGKHEVPVPFSGSIVAVKMNDMLGEELILTQEIQK